MTTEKKTAYIKASAPYECYSSGSRKGTNKGKTYADNGARNRIDPKGSTNDDRNGEYLPVCRLILPRSARGMY